jgi:hypothetical protein
VPPAGDGPPRSGPADTAAFAVEQPAWREADRVLRPGGILLAVFTNPALYVFADAEAEQGRLMARHAVSYPDVTSLTDEERRRHTDKHEPLVYGHTLEDQIGGQLDAEFVLTGFYEDRDPGHPLSRLLPTFVATRAVKPVE